MTYKLGKVDNEIRVVSEVVDVLLEQREVLEEQMGDYRWRRMKRMIRVDVINILYGNVRPLGCECENIEWRGSRIEA